MHVGSFEILAEVAVGIAGFGAIAIVLGRDHDSWGSADSFRTASLFMASLGALFLALFPIGLATSQLATGSIWRTSSAVMVLYSIAVSVVVLPARRRYLDRGLWLGPTSWAVVVASAMTNLLAQTLNATGIWFEPNATCYFFGVVYLLFAGCLLLLRIVFVRPAQR